MRGLMALNSQTVPPQRLILALGLGTGYLVVAGLFLRQYLLWNPQWLLGIALLPFITLPTERKFSPLLLVSIAVLLGLSAFSQITTIYFLGFLLVLWLVIQTVLGRSGIYPLLMLTVASPIFSYVADVLSFPLRLQLTKAAAAILDLGHSTVDVAGNIILLNGEEFSVDPACAGLNMLAFSLMIAVFLLAHLHKTSQKPWPYWLLFAFLLLMLGLNLICNLLRILVLVLLRIGPEDRMHDAVGLLCLIVYAILPFFFLARKVNQGRKSTSRPTAAGTREAFSGKAVVLQVSLLLCVAAAGYQVQHNRPLPQAAAPLQVPGFKKEVLLDGVHKFTNGQALLYMKPIRAFYSTEHHPMICWEGSGYLFKNIAPGMVAGNLVYTGTLTKGKDLLFTAWWMDNGQHQTIEQTDWRWRMAKGEPAFHLVNVTAASEEELHRQVQQLLGPPSKGKEQAKRYSFLTFP
ncbi:exosortase N [Sabulibacter ruber]|uniref:exosortase N n=1 Tax=Sabulibacter ruber TaxID=2811901 RepID=UPI001A972729|nr:exosortase N [Sabulibacter ruber]